MTTSSDTPAPRNPASTISSRLFDWYARSHRRFPWRAPPGGRADPYHVWLSEVMLQQTTTAAVTGFFEAFLRRWPRVEDLAAAPLDDVLAAWAGLGYYARARNLHRCAQTVASEHGGRFPDTVEGLRTLPGIGPYTAAAVAAIAFDRPSMPVDGNIERVVARLWTIDTPLPRAKQEIAGRAQELALPSGTGDLAQALMDLGATVCTPRTPRCLVCPIAEPCMARASGTPHRWPVLPTKRDRPARTGEVMWLERDDGSVLLRRRPPKGLLGGMREFPSHGWSDGDTPAGLLETIEAAASDWQPLPGLVRHGFTHFELTLTVRLGATGADTPAPEGCEWAALDTLGEKALPTLMRKVLRHRLAAGAP